MVIKPQKSNLCKNSREIADLKTRMDEEFSTRKRDIVHIDGYGDSPTIHILKQTELEEHPKSTSTAEFFHGIAYAKGEQNFEWSLPGHGRPYSTCGQTFAMGCDNAEAHASHKGKGETIAMNCARLECPIDYEAGCSKDAMRVLIRFAAKIYGSNKIAKVISEVKHELRHEKRGIVKKGIVSALEKLVSESKNPVKHIILSPDPGSVDWSTAKAFRKFRRATYKQLASVGIWAGAIFPHPYRLKCSSCGTHPIPDHKKECPECGSSVFEWYWSPHLHVLGFGWVEKTKENYSQHGCVVKNLGKRDSVFGTAQYLLSHAGISSRIHVVSWFGKMSINSMEKAPQVGSIKRYCVECERPYARLVWVGAEEPPPLIYDHTDPDLNEFSFDVSDWIGFSRYRNGDFGRTQESC